MILKYREFLLENNINTDDNSSRKCNTTELNAREVAIMDIIKDSDVYKDIVNYINSLYIYSDNKYVRNMICNIIMAIIKVDAEKTNIEGVLYSLRNAILELDGIFNTRWANNKNIKEEKRRRIKKYLKSLLDGPNISTTIHGWKEFVRKQLDYSKYEDSFAEDGIFQVHRTRLSMGNFNTRLKEYVFTDNISRESIIEEFKDLIHEKDNMKLDKFDIKSTINIKDESKRIVLKKGDTVEVKYNKWNKNDTLGEFFAISKGNLHEKFITDNITISNVREKEHQYSITDLFEKNPKIKNKYDNIILEFYSILTKEYKSIGDSILEDVRKSMCGIMFKENIFIKSNNIKLSWSIKGFRKHENRLSITYSIINEKDKYRYIGDPLNPHFRYPAE